MTEANCCPPPGYNAIGGERQTDGSLEVQIQDLAHRIRMNEEIPPTGLNVALTMLLDAHADRRKADEFARMSAVFEGTAKAAPWEKRRSPDEIREMAKESPVLASLLRVDETSPASGSEWEAMLQVPFAALRSASDIQCTPAGITVRRVLNALDHRERFGTMQDHLREAFRIISDYLEGHPLAYPGETPTGLKPAAEFPFSAAEVADAQKVHEMAVGGAAAPDVTVSYPGEPVNISPRTSAGLAIMAAKAIARDDQPVAERVRLLAILLRDCAKVVRNVAVTETARVLKERVGQQACRAATYMQHVADPGRPDWPAFESRVRDVLETGALDDSPCGPEELDANTADHIIESAQRLLIMQPAAASAIESHLTRSSIHDT